MEKNEVRPPNVKHIKRMKKKLGKLNKKIRHSKKKDNNLASKKNSIKKNLEELKRPGEPEESREPKNALTQYSLSKLSIRLK